MRRRQGRFWPEKSGPNQSGISLKSGSDAPGFLAHELAGEGQALAALRPAAEALIGYPFAPDTPASDFPHLGFTKRIARADDHSATFPVSYAIATGEDAVHSCD